MYVTGLLPKDPFGYLKEEFPGKPGGGEHDEDNVMADEAVRAADDLLRFCLAGGMKAALAEAEKRSEGWLNEGHGLRASVYDQAADDMRNSLEKNEEPDIEPHPLLMAVAARDWGEAMDVEVEDVDAPRGLYGVTALQLACLGGNGYLVRKLLEAGADPNVKDEFGNTALHYAAARGHAAQVEDLLRHGAQVDVENEQGVTPLETALANVSIEQNEVVDFLFEAGPEPGEYSHNLWELAVCTEHFTKRMIDAGMSVDALTQDEENGIVDVTPLMWAAKEGYLPSVECLLKNGANPLTIDGQGKTALDYVQENAINDPERVREMIREAQDKTLDRMKEDLALMAKRVVFGQNGWNATGTEINACPEGLREYLRDFKNEPGIRVTHNRELQEMIKKQLMENPKQASMLSKDLKTYQEEKTRRQQDKNQGR